MITQSVNQLISDKAVYKTAPATPGLLTSPVYVESILLLFIFWYYQELKGIIDYIMTIVFYKLRILAELLRSG